MAIIPGAGCAARNDSASGAQVIDGSLRFKGSKTTYLQRSQSGGNRRTFTWSGWIKPDGAYTGTSNNDWFTASEGNTTGGIDYGFGVRIYETSHNSHSNQLMIYEFENGAFKLRYISTQVFRDYSGFYHLVVAVDTTLATSTDRIKAYVNGERLTDWKSGFADAPSQNLELTVNEAGKNSQIGVAYDSGSGYVQQCDGYASNFYVIDGQQLDASYFGYTDPLTNTWRPKKFSAFDNPNNGINWSGSSNANWSGSLLSGYSYTDPFEGSWQAGGTISNSSGARVDNSGTSSLTWTNPYSTIPVNKLEILAHRDTSGTVEVNGTNVSTLVNATRIDTVWAEIPGVTSLSTITLRNDGGQAPVFYGVRINGYPLIDDIADNSFYLPLDGNTPLGEDQSGNNNDWTPTRYGINSTIIPNATSALPILNTSSGGNIALPGVRGQHAGIAVTVYNSGSGNKYYLDGEEAKSLSNYRGQTITFDQSDSTNSGHPLKFATAADAAGSTEYTSGVVYAGTPGTSSYYGVDFDGSDYLKVEQSSSQFSGQGDYTVEAWVKFDSFQTDAALWSNWNNSSSATRSILLECNSSNNGLKFMINAGGGGGDWVVLNDVRPIPTLGQWYHLCQTYDHSATTTKCYIDGVFFGQHTTITVYNDSNADLHIGTNAGNTNSEIDGQVTNFRWSNSVRYASNFTPSKAPFTSDANTVFLGCLDSSAATTAVTNNAGTISASGDPSVYTVTNLYGPHTKITVPSTAPNTLYYYCGNHTGMGGSISLSTDVKVADPDAWKCVLALPLVGGGGANNVGIDVSDKVNCTTNPKAISTLHGTATYNSKESNFYGGSLDLGAVSARNAIATTNGSPDFDFGATTNPWTIELWSWRTTNTPSGDYACVWEIVGTAGLGNGWLAFLGAHSSSNYFYYGYGGSSHSALTWSLSPTNQWVHQAFVCDGTTLYVLEDGICMVRSAISSLGGPPTSFGRSDGAIALGSQTWTGGASDRNFGGWQQDFRVYKGVAKYKDPGATGKLATVAATGEPFFAASSSPSTVPDSPSGAAYSSDLTKTPTGCVAFDGYEDYLTIASSSDLAFGTGDFTIEFWVYYLTDGTDVLFDMRPNPESTQGLYPVIYGGGGSGFTYFVDSAARITGSYPIINRWTHIAVSRSGTTTRMFVDGVHDPRASYNDSNNYLNGDTTIGSNADGTNNELEGYISNVRVLKGTALYTKDFTPSTSPLTNITNTKLLCCQGTNAVNYAVSPGSITANGKAVATTFSPFGDDIDMVLGKSSGYCTWNMNDKSTTQLVFNGGLEVGAASDNWQQVKGTIGVNSGKYYWEVRAITSTQINAMIGISDLLEKVTTYPGDDTGYSYVWGGNKYEAGTYTASVGASWIEGDVIGVALDCDGGTIKYYIRNILATTSTISTTKTWFPAISVYYSDSSIPKYTTNFGQKPFRYTPPEGGYQPLCNANIPSPGVTVPSNYIKPQIYTGNGGTNVIECGFKPDLVVCKARGNAWDWGVFDSVRSRAGNVYDYLKFNSADAQATGGTTALQSYNDKGFTMGADAAFNTNDATFISFNWKAGGNKGTFNIDDKSYASAAAAGLDGGSITPTGASIGTKQGFSIIKYTADLAEVPNSISHGLTQKPDFAIFKNMDSTLGANEVDWGIYHSSLGATLSLELNQDIAAQDYDGPFNDTEPTSSLFYFGGRSSGSIMAHSYLTNGPAGDDFIAYIWHNVPGVQKFGKYNGLGNNDGTYVYLGFRPALVWVKSSSEAGQEWVAWDDSRSPYNEITTSLYLDQNLTEASVGTTRKVDFLSNGFKLRNGTSGATDYTGRTYVYMAWADQPAQNLYGAQSNAR